MAAAATQRHTSYLLTAIGASEMAILYLEDIFLYVKCPWNDMLSYAIEKYTTSVP